MISRDDIDAGEAFEWGRASANYAKYRDIYPLEFYEKLIELGIGTRGQNVLDLGTGTGVLPRNLYRYGAKFTGVDVSPEQIEQAKRLSKQENMDIMYFSTPAEEIDFLKNSMDVVMACQCFMYFDPSILIPKLEQIIVSGGKLAILFLAWLPFEDKLAAETEALVLKYSPNWSGGGMKRELAPIPEWVEMSSFEVTQNIGFEVDLAFTRESWNGRIKACRGVEASLSPVEVKAFEKEHLAMLANYPEEFKIKHYTTMQIFRNSK